MHPLHPYRRRTPHNLALPPDSLSAGSPAPRAPAPLSPFLTTRALCRRGDRLGGPRGFLLLQDLRKKPWAHGLFPDGRPANAESPREELVVRHLAQRNLAHWGACRRGECHLDEKGVCVLWGNERHLGPFPGELWYVRSNKLRGDLNTGRSERPRGDQEISLPREVPFNKNYKCDLCSKLCSKFEVAPVCKCDVTTRSQPSNILPSHK